MTTFVTMRELTTPIARIRRSRHLAPVGLVLAAASLSVVTFVHVVRPGTHNATTLLHDHSNVELWRVVGAGVLAGGWAHWVWSALAGLAIFALLQERMGRASMLGCLVATHLAPAVAVAFVAPMLGQVDVLAYIDAATSCVIVVAAAGAVWSRQRATA